MAYNATTWQTGDIITAANLNKIEKELVGIEDIIADSYSASKKYAIGDYVIQETTINGSKVNKLYKCITAITNGEAWNPAHWEETKLKNEVGGKEGIASTFSTSTAYKAGEYVWYNGTLYRFTTDHAAGMWVGTDATAAVIGDDLAGLKNTIDEIVRGVDITHTVSAGGYQIINCLIINGGQYVFTNNTSAACSLDLLRADGTRKIVSGQVNAGASYTFFADEDDYVGIRSYANGTGTMTLTSDISAKTTMLERAVGNINGIVYETASATLSYETYGSNGGISFTITGNNKFTVRLETPNGRISKDVSFSDAASDAVDYITVDDSSAVIVLDRYSKTLVYNTTDELLHIRDLMVNGWQHADDILLIANAYARPVGGVLFREYMDRKNEAGYLKATDIFNAEPYTGDYDWQTPVVEYGKLFKGKNHVESFAFFTDPHVLGFGDGDRNETKMHNYLKRVQTAYNQTPCSYIVSCGDWLNNTTTMDEACYRLGQLKGIAEHMFGGLKIVLGNHDTNYQGKATPESENWTGRLTDETIAAIMYRDSETKKAYFSFEGNYATCYVLDSGTETGHSAMLTYDWEQLAWLAGKLSQDDPEHAIIFLHIIVSEDTVQTFAATFGQLVEAYNAHTTITLNGQAYDFTGCSGRVDLWVAGHTHADSNGLLGGVPYVISTTNAYSSDVPIIDLVLIDYDNNMLYLKRVGGKGTDRMISLTTGQLITG